MKPSIEDVVQFKHDVGQALSPEFITMVCQSLGHFWQDRQFGPGATIQVFPGKYSNLAKKHRYRGNDARSRRPPNHARVVQIIRIKKSRRSCSREGVALVA